ncbi:hypothetical protein THICB1_150064 [Thiomonas arsenitoxydans]|uniref:Uncharacterized protein n=1 Tax=Thiomonas arsenitoxydans (strain DSM 22701 / CIP 110005 / 3As) TaxID=426114 RepID=A0ABM9T3E9_THIA3|nr:hypothetical protein ACO7_130016 [Thiomonas arsenitoxydans]CQR29069.1 hypothetical protein ACO3_140016 [Thiomonas arsenitoxydans]CQR30567.1 hypothetical protein THICB1_150064 [Thiomonas arsenitoxydans]CQR35593.1 hypothetical protein THICB6_230048 [Thiomonas arsenitoxydans]
MAPQFQTAIRHLSQTVKTLYLASGGISTTIRSVEQIDSQPTAYAQVHAQSLPLERPRANPQGCSKPLKWKG